MLEGLAGALVLTHLLQFTIASALVAVASCGTTRRWPHFTFLLCMLALIKCLVPPVIPSPAGLFTLNQSVALSPLDLDRNHAKLVQLRSNANRVRGLETQAVERGALWGYATLAGIFEFAQGLNWSWGKTCLLGWLLGVAVVLGKSLMRYRAILKQVTDEYAPPRVQRMLRQLKLQMGVRRNLRIVVSDNNFGPGCIGFWRPTLVIPRAIANNMPDQLLEPILAHELVHVRRGDVIWGYVQYAAQVLWWFHPLVWWIGRRANLLCERCADEEVVAKLKCSPALYAESLVRILQYRNLLTPVPFGHHLSAAEITAQRLQWLVKRCDRFTPRTPLVGWLLAFAISAVTLPGMRWQASSDPLAKAASFENYGDDIMLLVEAQEWAAAETLMRRIVQADPQAPNAIFFLGYIVHKSGRLEEALELHQRAAGFPVVRAISLYNCACACALLQRREQALDYLQASLDAGFYNEVDLFDDADLSCLYGMDQFKHLHRRFLANAKTAKPVPDLDFLVGLWDVFRQSTEQVDSNAKSPEQGAQLLVEEWTSGNGLTETGIAYLYADKQHLKQVWIDAHGVVTELNGTFSGEVLELLGTAFDSSGQRTMQRTRIARSSNGVFSHLVEASRDEGQSWKITFQGQYIRSEDGRVKPVSNSSAYRPTSASRRAKRTMFVEPW